MEQLETDIADELSDDKAEDGSKLGGAGAGAKVARWVGSSVKLEDAGLKESGLFTAGDRKVVFGICSFAITSRISAASGMRR